MRLINFKTAINGIILTSAGLSGLAAAAQSASTTISNGQPNMNPALAAGLITTTGLTTANTIGTTVASVASGDFALAGGVRRFALGNGKTGQAASGSNSLWNGWVAYSRNNIGYNYAPLSSSGSVDLFLGGVDYRYNDSTVIGVAVGYDDTKVDLNFAPGGKLDANGYTISPYIGYALNRNVSLDATVGFGQTDVDTNVLGVSGSTRADRWMASLGATYRQKMDNWTFSGRGAFLTVHDDFDSYTLSDGTRVNDASVRVTQFRLTGQVAYEYGNFAPYLGVTYINDLQRPDQATISGVAPDNANTAWTPTIGLRFKTDGSVYGAIQYSTERNHGDVTNNQWLFNLGVRF